MSTAIATQQSTAPIQVGLTDSQSFELAQRIATCFSKSSLVPQQYQNNLPNCLIALNMAARMGADPLMVIQNLHVVHGRPGWSAQFLIATFNKSGRFSSMRYEFVGTEGTDDWGCKAKAIERETGEILEGTVITIAMAKKEGWYQKSGSKWQTMPQQMLMYRAASWFVRAYAPEIAMGLQTAEEVRDTYDMEPVGNSYVVPVRGEVGTDLNAIIEVQNGSESVQNEVENNGNAGVHTQELDGAAQPKQRKRLSTEELDARRADLVADIEGDGFDLKEIEKAVGEFSNRWSEKIMDKIENVILPNMRAERAGA